MWTFSHWPLSHIGWNKFKFFVCVFVSWLNFTLKIGKVGYFVQFSKYLYQNWWTSSHEPVSRIGQNKNSKICLWICQLVHWFTLSIIIKISVPSWLSWLKLSTFVIVIILVLMVINEWWWKWQWGWLGWAQLLPGRAVDPWSCLNEILRDKT